MEKEIFCKTILKAMNKSNVGVKVSQNIKGNYYSYINNCIYLTDKKISNNKEKAKENVTIAHECIHARQNKQNHIINVILSNLELVLFILVCIIFFAFKRIFILKIVYIFICFLALVCRHTLEIPAMIDSFDLAVKFSDNKIKEIINKDKEKIKYMIPIGMLSYSWFRLLRLVLIILI